MPQYYYSHLSFLMVLSLFVRNITHLDLNRPLWQPLPRCLIEGWRVSALFGIPQWTGLQVAICLEYYTLDYVQKSSNPKS
jgi:hypothetical protein